MTGTVLDTANMLFENTSCSMLTIDVIIDVFAVLTAKSAGNVKRCSDVSMVRCGDHVSPLRKHDESPMECRCNGCTSVFSTAGHGTHHSSDPAPAASTPLKSDERFAFFSMSAIGIGGLLLPMHTKLGGQSKHTALSEDSTPYLTWKLSRIRR